MKFSLTIFFLAFTFFSSNNDIQRRVISDSEFNYTFYILPEETKSNNVLKYYHWYKSGEIHTSQGSSSGSLLHGDYTKSYKNNDLAEKGSFKKGLKSNTWKRWYKNGQLYEISNWKNGLKSGRYAQFSEEGKVLIQGSYKNQRKHGIWINAVTNDTVFFKKGIAKEIPKRYSRKPFMQRSKAFFKNLFAKKEGQKNDSKSKNPQTTSSKKSKHVAKKQRVKKKKEKKEKDQK